MKVYIIQEDGDTVVKALPNRGSAEAGHDSTFAGDSPQEMAMTERQQFDAQWKDRPFRARTLKLFTDPEPWQRQALEAHGSRTISAYIEDNFVAFTLPAGDVIRLEHTLTKGMQKKRELLTSKRVDGSLDCKHWIFSTRVVQDFSWLFQPVGALGVDINLDLVVIWDGEKEEVWPASPELVRVTQRLEDLNDELWDREKVARSSQRRGVRKKIRNQGNRQRALLVPVYERVIDLAESKKLLLCLSRDRLVTELVKLCENRAVPFVIVPTSEGAMNNRELGLRIWERGLD